MLADGYGLSGRPFQLTPDPAFFFASQTHRKAMAYLSFALAQGEGFVVITGAAGTGKSTLAAHLLATVDPARLTAAQVVTGAEGEGELLLAAARAFGLAVPAGGAADAAARGSALAAFEAFLHGEAQAGRRCLLVVDEAQALGIAALEELRLLANIQRGARPLLQTLLLGEPDLHEAIHGNPRLDQLRQRVIAAHHLEPLEPAELRPYVEHRLACAGWRGAPAIDPAVFPALHAASGGVPRRINQIANRLLLLGAVEQRQGIDAAMLAEVLAELASDGQPAETGAAQVQALLAERDAQILELQQAVVELAGEPAGADTAQFEARLAALEARMTEQERTIRQTLTMLIEWIETEAAAQAAA